MDIEVLIAAGPGTFGGYTLLEEIGRGGAGVIFKARQPGLDRICALKMLLGDRFRDPAARTQLLAEARAAARLDHPNIVGIYEVGEEAGQPFFSMEFVEGENLGTFTRRRVLPAKQVAKYAKKIAEATHYAHTQGVLHCDLKPANVLIDPRDEPQVTDFGLARELGHRGEVTTGPGADGAGSPNFMAPEQASARFGELSVATDVFGLGATLYYLLTDRPPFRGETAEDTIRAVQELDPVRPRVLRPGVPVDLETICLKCLEKRQSKRYASAQEVADELGRFLRDEPIHARPISRWEREWRRARRHPWLTTFATATALLVALVAIGSTFAAYHIETARREAESERRKAERAAQTTRRNLYAADMALAFQALAGGKDSSVRDLLQNYVPTNGQPDLRGWEWRFLWSQSRSDDLGLVGRHDAAITGLKLLPDGRRLVASDNGFHVKIWDLVTGQVLHDAIPHRASTTLISVDPTGRVLALTERGAQDTNNRVRLINLADWTTNAEFRVSGYAGVKGFSPDGQLLWLVGDRRVSAYDTTTGKPIRDFVRAEDNPHRAFALSCDGRLLADAGESGGVSVFDAETGVERVHLAGHHAAPAFTAAPTALAFSPDGRLLASAGKDSAVRIWNVASGELYADLRGHADYIQSLAFSPDGRRLVSSGRDPVLRVWDVPGKRLEATLRGSRAIAFEMLFLPDGNEFLTGGVDGEIRRWPLAGRDPFPAFKDRPTNSIYEQFTADGGHFLWGTAPGSGGVRTLFTTHDLVKFDRDTNALAVGAVVPAQGPGLAARYSASGMIGILAFDGRLVRQLQETNWMPVPVGANVSVEFSADGGTLVVSDSYNGTTALRSADLSLIRHFPAPRISRAVVSPDGRWVVAGQVAGPPYLWNLATGRETVLIAAPPQLQAAAFSADVSLLATVGLNGSVVVFETASGKVLQHFTSAAANLVCVAVSPDHRRLVAGGLNGGLYVWDLDTGREMASYPAHQSAITDLRFLADGTLVTLAADGHRRWPAPPLKEIDGG